MILELTEGLPNAYKLMCFNKNVNGNRDVKFLECDYLLVHFNIQLTYQSGQLFCPLQDQCWTLQFHFLTK